MYFNGKEVDVKLNVRYTPYYALYRNDELLTVGTKKELADYLGVKERTIHFYSTPTYAKRNKGGYRVYRIEDDKDERDTKIYK